MLKRTITGFFIILILAGFVALRQVSLYFFDILALAIIMGSVHEIVMAAKVGGKKILLPLVFAYPVILGIIYIFATNFKDALLYQVLALLGCFIILMAYELILNCVLRKAGKTETDQDKLNQSLLNTTKHTMEILLYPTTLLGVLFGLNHFGLNLGYVAIIMVFMITMTTDVFAYLFGSMLKGPKMAPEISPKKSISGMIFGALGGVIAAGLGYLFFVHLGWFGALAYLGTAKQILIFVICGVLGTFLTQFGDLVASAYKRKVGIKDFGKIFPGHGGFMDRVDGLMFTAALVFVVFALFI